MFPFLPLGCLSLLLLGFLALLFPFLLADVVVSALAKLGLSPSTSAAAAFGIFFGGLVNIPVRRIPREVSVETGPVGLFGIDRALRRETRVRAETVIAVNVGGCVIPSLIAAYELARIHAAGPGPLAGAAAAIVIDVIVCYRLARIVPRVGIALPAFVPGLVAAGCAYLFARELAAPVAFTAGVLGPLVGADLLHLRGISRSTFGAVSIGGAGTFDGIVISGLLAALLA